MAVTNINDVPGLSEQYNTLVANPQTRNQAVALAKQAMADPVKYVEGTLSSTILNDNTLNNNFANTNKAIQFLKDNGVSAAEVKSSYEGALADAQRSLLEAQNRGGGFFEDVLSSPLTQIALAYYLPGVGEALGAQLGVSSAVGTALASTAVQVANGADFETALRNATVNAVVSTGSPTVANDIAKAVGSTGVADAVTSAGASIASTLAKGGNMSEALNNAGAAIAASGASQASDSRAVGAAVGGGITGGATGAALGAAGEAGRPTPTAPGVKVASAGDLISEPGVISDTPTDVGLTEIVAPKEPGIGSTDVQVLDTIRSQQDKAASPSATTTPSTPAATTTVPEVVVTAPKEQANIAATDIQTVSDIPTVEVVGKREEIPTITVTAPKEPSITDTDVQIEDPITDIPEEPAEPEEPGPRSTDIFVYGGSKSPSSLSKSLGTTFQAPYYPGTAAQGLTAERGAGEIEGTETGKKRKNVWNEASLRLKDALGL
jgi:hypothetical protein